METYQDQGILYSKDHFSEELIAELFTPPEELKPSEAAEIPGGKEPLPEANEEAAFEHAWAEMSQDPQFVAAMAKQGYTKQKGLEDFKRAMKTVVTKASEEKVAATLTTSYERTIEGGAYVHKLAGERILVIPQDHPQALTASKTADKVLCTIFVVLDVLAIVAAAAGIYYAGQKAKLAPNMEKPLFGFIKFIKRPNAPVVREMAELTKKGKVVDAVLKVLGSLRGTTNLTTVVRGYFSSMSYFEMGVATVQLVAAVTLLIASFGSSLAVQIVALSALTVILATDVASLAVACAT